MPYSNSDLMSVEGGKWGFKVGWSTNLEQKYKYHRRRVTEQREAGYYEVVSPQARG